MDEWEQVFKKKIKRLEDNKAFNESSKVLVLEYIRSKQGENVGAHRLNRILDFLWHMLETFNYDYKWLSEDKLVEITIWINNNPEWKDWTKYSYASILRSFTTWLNERYKLGLNIKIKHKMPKNSVMPEYLLTAEELNKLINATDDLQTKLLLGVLYESGARIGEILTLKIQNVSFNTYGARLSVKGKTGQRITPIIWYSNMLRQFLEGHPYKQYSDSCLWFYQENGKVLPLNYDQIRMRLKRLACKVGINKRINPHLFRHTRMTELAKDLPEQTLKVLAGWAGDSRMAKTYIHLSNKDVEDSLLSKVYGIQTNASSKEEKSHICVRCGEVSPFFAKLCQRCKTPLDERELREEVISSDKSKEIESWSKNIMAFLRVVEKKHPDIWDDMKDILNKK